MFKGYRNSEMCFKLFGVENQALIQAKEQIAALSDNKIKFTYQTEYGDVTVCFSFGADVDELNADSVIKSFIKTFSSVIYADQNVSLNEHAVNLLKLNRKVLCSAESFTGGGIARSIVQVPGASEVFYEGLVCYNTMAKHELLGVSPQTVRLKTVVSRDVAYEMARGLILSGKCDLAVATTGYASPCDDKTKPVGLCYIAAGGSNSIEVRRYNFFGTREEIMEQGKNAALFMLCKQLGA